MKKITEHQVPKSIHIQHVEMQHRYLKNQKLPPMLPRAKKLSQTHEYLEVTQQSKKQNKGKRKDEEEKKKTKRKRRMKLGLSIWISRKFPKTEKNPYNNKAEETSRMSP